jgi:hypothetical protein
MAIRFFLIIGLLLVSGCDISELNNPYPESENQQAILYQSFSERPKHLDPAIAFT